MKKRILLAGLFHESNTFASGKTKLSHYTTLLGQDLLSQNDTASPMGAFLDEVRNFDWEIVPTIDIRTGPGPASEKAVTDFFFNEFESRVAQEKAPLNGIFLVMHGAMCSETLEDVEGEFLRRIRQIPSLKSLPIFGVLDLHGNFTELMAEHSNALLAYQENPHTDAAESSRRAARLMQHSFQKGLTLKTRFVPTPILWAAAGTGTSDSPMKDLELLARQEEREGIHEISVFAGFAHSDIHDAGLSFTIVYDPNIVSKERLEALADKLQKKALELKEKGIPYEWDLDQAIEEALKKKLFPTCLVEPADNIGGGAWGDGTTILRAFLKKGITRSGVVLYDPEAVTFLKKISLGSTFELAIGGKTFSLDPGPLLVKGRLIHLSDGKFTLEDRNSHLASMSGMQFCMGDSALIEVEGVTILLTSIPTPPMDLGQWRSQGINPEEFQFIGIKAAVAHRRAYDPFTKASYTVKTPGPGASDLKSLPYKKIRQPIFPLHF